MPRYGINPFTGELVPIYGATAVGGSGGDVDGDRFRIIQYPELSREWLIDSPSAYATPTIYVSQIGDRTFNPAIQVSAPWEYPNNDPYKIQIRFSPHPCAGYCLLHFN